MTPSPINISYIIPVFNEQDAVTQTILSVDTVLRKLGRQYEIIVINDGSTDCTAERLNELSLDSLVLLEHPINAGYGAAIKSGLHQAQYPWVGIIDGDGSYDSEAIPELIMAIDEGFDMVVAKRQNIRKKDSLIKYGFRRILENLVRAMISRSIEDTNSGLRVMRKAAVMEFFPFLCSTFSFTTSLTILFLERGYFIKYLPTTYSDRSGRSKVRHFRDSVIALLMVVRGITFFNPLKFSIYLLIGFIAFICVPAMILAWVNMQTLSLYYILFGVVTVLLMALGILGDIIRVSAIRSRYIDDEHLAVNSYRVVKIKSDNESMS